MKTSKQATQTTQTTLNTPRLTVIATEIKAHVEQINSHAFETGKLLSESFDMFAKSKDWLVWVDVNCNLKKAQTYRLKSVYDTFKDQPELSNMSLRALTQLIGTDDEVKKLALELAKQDKPLNDKEIKEIQGELDEEKGTTPPKKEKKQLEDMTPQQAAKHCEQVSQAAKDSADKFTKTIKKATEARDAAITTSQSVSKLLAEKTKLADKLQADNDKLHAEIKELVSKLEAKEAELVAAKTIKTPKPKKDMTKGTKEVQNGFDFGDIEPLEEIKEPKDSSVQLLDFENAYLELATAKPTRLANNTMVAAGLAGIETTKKGHVTYFILGDESLTGDKLRAKINY